MLRAAWTLVSLTCSAAVLSTVTLLACREVTGDDDQTAGYLDFMLRLASNHPWLAVTSVLVAVAWTLPTAPGRS